MILCLCTESEMGLYLNLLSDMQREKNPNPVGQHSGRHEAWAVPRDARRLPTDAPDLWFQEIITSEPSCELLVVYFIQLNMAELCEQCTINMIH